MARELTVELGERSYPIRIGPGLLKRADALAPQLAGDRALVVTNETVAPLWLEPLLEGLAAGGVTRVDTLVLPDGEAHKTLATLETIFDRLIERRHDRGTTVVALGGGVVGDLAGFAAACYQRGVAFAQVPTTLLAQVDSSVGGKTAVNHPAGKNMIGAFHQPVAVLADTDLLATLPPREYAAGLAEVVKYGVIWSEPFFRWLETNREPLLDRDAEAVAHAVYESCACKAAVVARDEREADLRAILNFGHTFGHAIEALGGYGTWLHGEAVAAGMVMAARLSVMTGRLDAAQPARLAALLEAFGLPTWAPAAVLVDPERFVATMGLDKKVRDGRIRLVLMRALGTVEVTADYPEDMLMELLAQTDAGLG